MTKTPRAAKTNTNKVKRVPDSFTYDEYRRYYYQQPKEQTPPQDAEELGRSIARDAIKIIRTQLKTK